MLAFLVGGSACTIMLFDAFVRWRASRNEPELSVTRPVRNLIGVFAVVLTVLGTVLVVNVGHSGARATWDANRDSAPTVSYEGD